MSHIKLEHEVLSVTRSGADGKFTVRVRNLRDGGEQALAFDAVSVAVGAHQHAVVPDIEGKDLFKGKLVHTSGYVNVNSFNNAFEGKRVLCIGMGESGADVVREISNVSEQTYLVVKQWPFCIPRQLPDGTPADALTGRGVYFQRDDSLLLWIVVTLVWFLLWLPLSFTRWGTKYVTWKGQEGGDVVTCFGNKRSANYFDINTHRTAECVELMCKWHTEENCSWANKFATKNVTFIPNVVNGKIDMRRGKVVRLTERSAVLQDGTEIDNLDTIMFCTGYDDYFPFLDPSLCPKGGDVKNLFMHAIHPTVGADLCFVGWARPSTGAVPGCSELIARYHALLLSGKRKLPANVEQRTQVEKKREDEMFTLSKQIRSLVNPCDYMDEMARLIGCFQSPWAYWYHPLRFFFWNMGANFLARYRLVGPHAKPKLARAWLDEMNYPLPNPGIGFCLYWKIRYCLGYASGDFIVDARTKWGVEVTKAIGMGAPRATAAELPPKKKN